MMVLCGLGYAVPWGVLNNHGRLHLQDNGLGISAAAGVLGTMVLVSTFGRLAGGLGDFLPKYAGNLDIMTAAGLRTAEMYAEEILAGKFAPAAA